MNKFKVQSPKSKIKKPIFAKKSFGQNFLIDQNYVDKIISALNPQIDETIIEIGAGRGALTERLVEKSGKVLAIELDRDLIPFLKENFSNKENFELVEADALKIDFYELTKTKNQKTKTKLVANLPYYISTAILQKIIEQRECFSEMILMFQREVSERITARAGDSGRGFLTVLVEAYLESEKLFDVPPNAFRPAPKVWSSVMRLITNNVNFINIKNDDFFRELVSAGFRQKRKTIFNNLKNFLPLIDMKIILENCGIEPERRAESLTLTEWKRLSDSIAASGV